MAIAVGLINRRYPSDLRLCQQSASAITRNRDHKKRPPILISTNPSHIDLHRLSQLYSSCNQSCHRFPNFDADGCVEAVDVGKLGVAVSNSSVVVSVFSRIIDEEEERWWRRMLPVTPTSGRLVGFGRVVSDLGLTASIHDVMVIPHLRRMGIGRLIVQKIVRMLTNREIFDIVVLCSKNERLFFKACGFGDDILGSTTMMYSRTALSNLEGYQTVQAGQKLLLPPLQRFSL
ncbi:hypothetical protein Nepgr_006837 [Nepenthes gracilis]|uniref:N-acetyltransferase domain-containing protein n=1 Tax=Nepenthes gracilis TaxID=150966 RepID=A0AAD3S6K7_NEPGR|nr:hypothetical protein Nepgr_006837 [Nepenthes gracilis]